MDYIKIWKEVMLKPAEFFMEMPTTGGYVDPLTFAAISYIISWLLSIFVSFNMLTMDDSKFSFSDLKAISLILGI